MSFLQVMGALTKIQAGFEKSRKVAGPRALQSSEFGMLCLCDTPVGGSSGLVKHLALTTHVSTPEEEGPLISLCSNLGVENLELLPGLPLRSRKSYLVILNGVILGKHSSPQVFASSIRRLRRCGRIGECVSVFVDDEQFCVNIASDEGRMCRPFIIADKCVSMVKGEHMQLLVDGVWNLDHFIHNGLIEYLDVYEQQNALIALAEDKKQRGATHIEIEPFTILGVSAGLVPYPHHNGILRSIYQCAVGRQAMGNIAYNQLFRMDSLLRILVYPHRPLLTTDTIELIHYDKLGAGQNAVVAVMSEGYNTQDAIVMNKSSLDRGFGRCIVMKREGAVFQRHDNRASDIPISTNTEGHSTEKMQALDDDGIAFPGQPISDGDFLVTPTITRVQLLRSNSLKHRGLAGEKDVVDRVALFSNENSNLCVNIVSRRTHRPEEGDKFSSRHAQIGVCGAIVPQEDLVFSERGICPDLIMNPHGFVSPPAIGSLLELIGSKAGASCGSFYYGTAFGESSGLSATAEDISKMLVRHGFSYDGKDLLYSGVSGNPLSAYIFMGTIYYQRLKHMVSEKLQVHSRPRRDILTRQPTQGLRLGERERDCLIPHGVSALLYERFMLSGDKYEVQVCRACGLLGYYNHRLKVPVCSMCKQADNVSIIKLPYACKLLFQELQSMNIVPRVKLEDA